MLNWPSVTRAQFVNEDYSKTIIVQNNGYSPITRFKTNVNYKMFNVPNYCPSHRAVKILTDVSF